MSGEKQKKMFETENVKSWKFSREKAFARAKRMLFNIRSSALKWKVSSKKRNFMGLHFKLHT